MSSIASVVNNLMEQKLTGLHTAFVGVVLSVNVKRRRARVRPLAAAGAQDRGHTPLDEVPVLAGALYKPTGGAGEGGPGWAAIAKGDICLCVCCERDMAGALHGQAGAGNGWRHSLSDAVVVGVF